MQLTKCSPSFLFRSQVRPSLKQEQSGHARAPFTCNVKTSIYGRPRALHAQTMEFRPDYERHCTRILHSHHRGLQDILFVDGLSASVEFHMNELFKLDWPATPKYLHTFDFNHPEQLTEILEQNSFKLIVLANLVGDFEQYYADNPSRGRWQYAQQRENLQRLETAVKASVVEKGATMVLFCSEMSGWVYTKMFEKPWKQADYVRTSCFRAPSASCVVPNAPSSINAKAVHVQDVPWEEHWYVTIGASEINALIPAMQSLSLRPGLCSVALGSAGAGHIAYMGDVNAEPSTCQVVQQLAVHIFKRQPVPRNSHATPGVPLLEHAKRLADPQSSEAAKRVRVEPEEAAVVQHAVQEPILAAPETPPAESNNAQPQAQRQEPGTPPQQYGFNDFLPQSAAGWYQPCGSWETRQQYRQGMVLYRNGLINYLRGYGRTGLGQLGSYVKKPLSVPSLKQFLLWDPLIFRLDGTTREFVSLV